METWIDVYWGKDIQKAIDNATQGVRIHNCANPDTSEPVLKRLGSYDFEIGDNTIQIENKGSFDNPFEIVGIIGENKEEIKELRDDMPVIHGTSTAKMFAGEESKGVGIFHIGPGCFVKISGLHLLQDVVTDHGSATIAHLVGNVPGDINRSSSLEVSNCKIDTIATAAISVRSNVASTPSAQHDIVIRGCHVVGRPDPAKNPDPDAHRGNYSSINLGYWGSKPLSVSTFKVSGCILESLFLGVAVWYVSSDSNSMFLVAGNDIGIGKGYDGKGNDGTAVGVSFISRLLYPQYPASLPHGTIAIIENKMRIGKYLSGSAGVLVCADKDPQVRTIISHNAIYMALPSGDSNPPETVRGIAYQPSAAFTESTNFACNVTADIHNNSISLSPAAKAPGYGIYLGQFSHLVRVTDNQLKEMTASTALIGVDIDASRNIVVGNEFGKLSNGAKAGILCDGSENSISENDFTASAIPGGTDKVCVRLGLHSKKNLAVLKQAEVPGGTVANSQWINEPNLSSEENVVKVIPEFELAPIISQISPEAWIDFVMYYLEDLKLFIRQSPISPPGPPVTLRRISQLKREVLVNLAKAGD